jgi:UDP-glucose 4-epimerase
LNEGARHGGKWFCRVCTGTTTFADELATEIVAAVRSSVCDFPTGVERIVVGGIDEANDWRDALTGCEVVIHLAASVHVMQEATADPLAEFRRVNVQGTLNLARQAAAASVRRFVFVSSIKVNGEATQLGRPFTADDAPAPLDAYGVSKMEAEQGLRELAWQTGIEVVIIRPPLVYGPGVKAKQP